LRTIVSSQEQVIIRLLALSHLMAITKYPLTFWERQMPTPLLKKSSHQQAHRPAHLLRRTLVPLALSLTLEQSAQSEEPPVTLERWRSYSGVTWVSADNPIQIPFKNSVNAPIAGIHFDANGRAFVSTPRVISPDAPATLSVLDTRSESGPARLTAYPSEAGNVIDRNPETALRNVLGFYIDQRNGWLWALDMGFVAGETEAPIGAQKVVIFELTSGRVIKRIALDTVADRKGSFLNDITVDERNQRAYISDSGLRSAPANQAAIITVDVKTGKVRRLLHQHPAVMPEPGVRVMSHGSEVWPGNPLLVGINGIALSPDARTLYWAVTAGTQAYAISTRLLQSSHASTAQLDAAVKRLGDVGGNTDGIVSDTQGQLYLTDVTRNGIVRYNPQQPKTRAMTLIASDADIYWPDTPTITPDNYLVLTASQLNQHFAGAVKAGEERYELWRMPLNAKRKAQKPLSP
jgi:sugar lactone lactonase YvrE